MAIWPGPISAITLFAEDLAATKQFYIEVFGLPVFYEDPNSAVFKFGDTLINLLDVGEAPELIEPARVATQDAGSRFQFTLAVDDVDAMCAELSPVASPSSTARSTARGASAPPASPIPPATSGRSRSRSVGLATRTPRPRTHAARTWHRARNWQDTHPGNVKADPYRRFG